MPTINVGRVRPVLRGDYSPATSYAYLDVVAYQGESFISKQAVPAATPPPNATYWQKLAGQGGVSFESVAKNITSKDSQAFYDLAGNLTSVVFDLGGGQSITKTYTYNLSGNLETIVLSGDTPLGISLTKTILYDAGVFAGVAYS